MADDAPPVRSDETGGAPPSPSQDESSLSAPLAPVESTRAQAADTDRAAAASATTDGTSGALPPGALWQPGPTPKRSRRRRLSIVLGVVVLVVAALAVRSIISQTAANYAASVFGNPIQRLSADHRDQLERRFDAILGDRLDGKSQAEIAAEVERVARAGMPRLDDARLVKRLQLQTKGLSAMSDAECAMFGRPSMSGQPIPNEVGQALMRSLEAEDLGLWLDIAADAIEAEIAGTPAPRRVTDADVEGIFAELFEDIEPETVTLISDVSADPAAATDADACAALRALYDASVGLGSPSIDMVARYDIS